MSLVTLACIGSVLYVPQSVCVKMTAAGMHRMEPVDARDTRFGGHLEEHVGEVCCGFDASKSTPPIHS